jgi:hypothetical protein
MRGALSRVFRGKIRLRIRDFDKPARVARLLR